MATKKKAKKKSKKNTQPRKKATPKPTADDNKAPQSTEKFGEDGELIGSSEF